MASDSISIPGRRVLRSSVHAGNLGTSANITTVGNASDSADVVPVSKKRTANIKDSGNFEREVHTSK